LGHLRLVRRVGGDELRTAGEGPHDRRDLVVVGAAPGEADRAGAGVARPERLEPGDEVGLGEGLRKREACATDRLRDRGVELIEARQAEELEHRGDVRVGVGNEAPHGPP